MNERPSCQAPAGHTPDQPGTGRAVAIDGTPSLQLLVPINANEDSRWGVRYAARRRLAGAHVEVVLLNVGEPITRWEVLRFRTPQEIGQFQAERAQAFIDEAAAPLREQGIAVRGVFRQGALVFSILDAAEEFACDEIVMPHHRCALSGVFAGGTLAEARRRQRSVPVVAVDAEGRAV